MSRGVNEENIMELLTARLAPVPGLHAPDCRRRRTKNGTGRRSFADRSPLPRPSLAMPLLLALPPSPCASAPGILCQTEASESMTWQVQERERAEEEARTYEDLRRGGGRSRPGSNGAINRLVNHPHGVSASKVLHVYRRCTGVEALVR